MLCTLHFVPDPCLDQAGYVIAKNIMTSLTTCKAHSNTPLISCINHQFAHLNGPWLDALAPSYPIVTTREAVQCQYD